AEHLADRAAGQAVEGRADRDSGDRSRLRMRHRVTLATGCPPPVLPPSAPRQVAGAQRDRRDDAAAALDEDLRTAGDRQLSFVGRPRDRAREDTPLQAEA